MTKSNRLLPSAAVWTTTAALAGIFLFAGDVFAQNAVGPANGPSDPGVRGGAAGAGGSIGNLDNQSQKFFQTAKDRFQETDAVADGLGPRFNGDSCAGCHAQPAVGGSSPAINPQVALATLNGAKNTLPSFISPDGPVREARYVSDGGVHALFVVSGRSDAPGCTIQQPDFATEVAKRNVSFRIPTPTFGLGLVENTPDEKLFADAAALADLRTTFSIGGHFNYSGNDGTITRFGWKAQNKSLLMFAGEAYNVETGVTNALFPNKRDDDVNCQYNPLPEDSTDISQNGLVSTAVSDITSFATFMQLTASPSPAAATASTTRGQQVFNTIGCNLCHIPQHTTAPSKFAGLSQVTYFPYSDFQLHNMGDNLADRIAQGGANGYEFRTAPLWGLGQRLFFLHDGRTKDLLQAILAHSSNGSEANKVIAKFGALSTPDQQSLLDFLRSL